MKVDFSTVHPYSIPQNRNVGKTKATDAVNNSIISRGSVVHISFKGNLDKNFSQVASIAAEDKGLGIPEYSQGGLGVVAKELPESLNAKEGMDMRTFVPYHTYGANGGIRVLKVEYKDGKRVDSVDPSKFKSVGTDYKLKEGEKFVIQSAPSKGLSKFVELEATGISGEVSRVSPTSLAEEKVPYHVYKVVNLPHETKVTRYVVHTPALAMFEHSYGGAAYGAYSNQARALGAYGTAGISSDMAYAENDRAVVDALPKMAKREGFNPGNIIAHDRTAFPAIAEVASRSANGEKYFDGLRVDGRLHNPGRDYQGFYEDPLSFFRVVAGKHEIEALKKSPSYEKLKELAQKIQSGHASPQDRATVERILKPFLSGFVDDLGTYNITMIPAHGAQVNPRNMTIGTVSMNYGKEIANEKTSDMARGLTKTFAKINLINITNGSSPAALKLDKPDAGFARGGNGLTANQAGFTTYAPKFDENRRLTNVNEILQAKEKNKKWFLDLVGKTDASRPHALQELFFEPELIHPKSGRASTVLGQLSEYKEGDKLLIGWGRPDPQKGFPTTFEGFLKFLKDPNVSEETKIHTKLIVGAGPGNWEPSARDWKNIRKTYEEIAELDGGKYRGNAMYVNGMFPNRLAGCADYSIFTSVYEPCGITPLESYAAGSPVISIRTGGAPDFVSHFDPKKGAVTSETGFLTEDPYLLNKEDVGITDEALSSQPKHKHFEIVDDARRAKSSDQVADCIRDAVTLNQDNYKKMVANSIEQEIEWHNNGRYNNGVSANKRYLTEVFEIDPETKLPNKARNQGPLKSLFGFFGSIAEKAKTAVFGSNGQSQEVTEYLNQKVTEAKTAAATATEVTSRLNDATDTARGVTKTLESTITKANNVVPLVESATTKAKEATAVASQASEKLIAASSQTETLLDRATKVGGQIEASISQAAAQAETKTKELIAQAEAIAKNAEKNIKATKVNKAIAGVVIGATAVNGAILYFTRQAAQKIAANSKK